MSVTIVDNSEVKLFALRREVQFIPYINRREQTIGNVTLRWVGFDKADSALQDAIVEYINNDYDRVLGTGIYKGKIPATSFHGREFLLAWQESRLVGTLGVGVSESGLDGLPLAGDVGNTNLYTIKKNIRNTNYRGEIGRFTVDQRVRRAVVSLGYKMVGGYFLAKILDKKEYGVDALPVITPVIGRNMSDVIGYEDPSTTLYIKMIAQLRKELKGLGYKPNISMVAFLLGDSRYIDFESWEQELKGESNKFNLDLQVIRLETDRYGLTYDALCIYKGFYESWERVFEAQLADTTRLKKGPALVLTSTTTL